MKGKERLGVREEPFFKVPISRVIWPVLHTLIGIGNNILSNFVQIVDSEIEVMTPQEMRLRESLGKFDEMIFHASEERDEWDMDDNATSGSNMLKALKTQRRESADPNAVEQLSNEINKLELERKALQKKIADLRSEKSRCTNLIREFVSQRKTDANSIYTFVDKVLI